MRDKIRFQEKVCLSEKQKVNDFADRLKLEFSDPIVRQYILYSGIAGVKARQEDFCQKFSVSRTTLYRHLLKIEPERLFQAIQKVSILAVSERFSRMLYQILQKGEKGKITHADIAFLEFLTGRQRPDVQVQNQIQIQTIQSPRKVTKEDFEDVYQRLHQGQEE